MKNIIKVSLSFIIIATSILLYAHGTGSLNYKSYYNCPSDDLYVPPITQSQFCEHYRKPTMAECEEAYKGFPGYDTSTCSKFMASISKISCSELYNNMYGKANAEYKSGKCKVSEVKYIDDTYGTAKCRVSFAINPKPYVAGYEPLNNIPVQGEGAKCFDKVFNKIKAVYPNVSTGIKFYNK